jgi:probable rRNA maturation factor
VQVDWQRLAHALVDCLPSPPAVPLGFTVLLTDNATIEQYNREYLGVHRPTDVLSFPTYDGFTASWIPKSAIAEPITPDNPFLWIGDIICAFERSESDAMALGHTLPRHLCWLISHGFYHLLGWDHRTHSEEKAMRFLEDRAWEHYTSASS